MSNQWKVKSNEWSIENTANFPGPLSNEKQAIS